jgi:hypothetical protein
MLAWNRSTRNGGEPPTCDPWPSVMPSFASKASRDGT